MDFCPVCYDILGGVMSDWIWLDDDGEWAERYCSECQYSEEEYSMVEEEYSMVDEEN